MHQTKLIEALKALSYKELKRFNLYITSPFFNTNQRAVDFLQLLKPHHPEFAEDKVLKATIFKRLFPKEKYDDKKMRYASSDLYKLLEEYLVYIEFEKEKTRKKHYLLRSLDRRNQSKPFQQNLNEANKMLEKRPYQDVNYFYNKILLEEDLYIFNLSRKSRTGDHNIQTLLDNIDIHFLYRKLQYSCVILNLGNILSVEYDLSFLEAIVDFLKRNPPPTPALKIYLQILLTLQESEKEEHYTQLKGLLGQHLELFSKEELRDMYTYAQNYCIKRVNQGDDQYLKELFELYQLQLKAEIIIENLAISQFDFKNISTVAIRLGNYEWVEEFTIKFKGYLRKEFRKKASEYNLARINFYQGEYRKALRHLLDVDADDVYYQLGSKSLLLKIYYELNEYEPLLSLITSFRTYLRRNNSISDYQKRIYTNLVNFVKQLSKVKMGGKKSIHLIREEIGEIKEIADLTWLKSKVEELA